MSSEEIERFLNGRQNLFLVRYDPRFDEQYDISAQLWRPDLNGELVKVVRLSNSHGLYLEVRGIEKNISSWYEPEELIHVSEFFKKKLMNEAAPASKEPETKEEAPHVQLGQRFIDL